MGTRGIRIVNGRLQVGYTFHGERRREVLKWRDTPLNRAKAELLKAALDECTSDLDLFRVYEKHYPESKYHVGHTIGALLTDWLERIQPTAAPSTYRDYYNTVTTQLVPAFGTLHIQALRWRHIRDFVEKRRVSRKRLHNLLIPLRQVCDRAVEDEQIAASPFQGQKIEGTVSQHQPDPFTREEIAALVAAAAPGFGNLIEFACWSGLRTGELIALAWADVDWRRGIVAVRENVAGGVRKGPKTAAGVRDVILLPPARAALQRQKALSFLAGGAIFHDPLTGKPWVSDSSIRKRWIPLLRRAGIRYRRPYSTRDTYASQLLSAGENPMWVASQLGHRDWHVLRRSYAAWIDADAAGGRAILATLADPATATEGQRSG